MLEALSQTMGFWPALAYAFIAFFASMMVMNKGSWWIVNVSAQKEPALIAVGVFLIAHYPTVMGLSSAYVGGLLVIVGVMSRYTGLFNV